MLQCEHHTIHWLSLVLACCFQIRLSMRNIKDFNFVTLLLFTSYWGFYTQGRVLITFCRALLPSLSHWTWWVRAVTELPVFRSCRGCISLQNSSKPTRPTGPKRLVFVTNMCHFQYTRIQECFVIYIYIYISFSSVGQSIKTSKLWLSWEQLVSWMSRGRNLSHDWRQNKGTPDM